MAHKHDDLKKMKKLIEIMKDNDLIEVEIKHGDDKILLKRSGPQQPTLTAVPLAAAMGGAGVVEAGSAMAAAAGKRVDDGLIEIKSPLVGTFYATPSPDSEPFVEVDAKVEPQTVVCIIEAMKVMNEIKAEVNGTIAEILVTNGQAIEYGQAIFKVKPE